VLTGFVMKGTLLKGEATPFIMELPPYHLPTLKGVALRTLDRTQGFVVRAGQIIVPMVLVLNVMNSVGTDGSFGNEDSDKSILAEVGRTLSPAFAPMGLDAENWPATVGIFTGLLAKEAVVGTLDATYSALAAAETGETADEAPFDLTAGLLGALATIPTNLGDSLGSWADPMGLNVGDLTDTAEVAASQELTTGTFGAMASRFDGAAGAFAYLLFILLYAPCVAAIAAIYRETSPGWAVFTVLWTTGLGYIVATVFYQSAIFARDPTSSAAWIAAMVAIFATVVLGMRFWAQRGSAAATLVREGA
jgi:ferrous iron transport protein B